MIKKDGLYNNDEVNSRLRNKKKMKFPKNNIKGYEIF